MKKPLLLFTLGDVAGVGPEIIVKAWPDLNRLCHPIVVGNQLWLQQAVDLLGSSVRITDNAEPSALVLPFIRGTTLSLDDVQRSQVSAAAGQAAYDFLCTAIDLTLDGKADGIVTAPLHKEGLHGAGLSYPGHTEILADRCKVKEHAMLLYVNGLGVAHVTLHMSLRDVHDHLTTEAVLEKTLLIHSIMKTLLGREPRLAVAALNPHAGDGGLFGDEEERIIRPAVQQALQSGLNVAGPLPADTLFLRATKGDFDGIVAMYHDQGHIPLKLLGEWQAVNITLGLPIVRTSVAHGTAYDIAWQGKASIDSLIAATEVAVKLTRRRNGICK